jgi:hypothetical protein
LRLIVPAELARRNAVVDTSEAVETYPSVPKPIVVDVSEMPPAELARRNAVVDTSEAVET